MIKQKNSLSIAMAGVLVLSLAGCGETDEFRQVPTHPVADGASTPSKASTPEADSRAPVPGPTEPHDEVWIPAGTFVMGADRGDPNHRPAREVRMDGFWMDETPVTNTQFKAFVDATGYITTAEKPIPREVLPANIRFRVPEANLTPRSMVFIGTPRPVRLNNELQWWDLIPGADWQHPEGPGSTIKDRMDHPVVHVTYEDALAYCDWAGRALPTEAQFEYAMRGGLESNAYAWGNEKVPDEGWQANIWQGQFPVSNSEDDGYTLTSPVRSYPANGYGLYDMSGNVWEWCRDWFDHDYYAEAPIANPPGPMRYEDPGPRGRDGIDKRVIRGGSFLCSDSYCLGYMPMSRQASDPLTAHNHTGFRTIDLTRTPPEARPRAVDPLPGE
ncbi:MAG: formylglycine-generating enzyme family protein [Planctomycetota bacterium]